MRRGTLCLLLISLLLVGFFAQGFLASTVFDWYIKGYCNKCLNGQLAYESIHHENGVWTINQPSFLSHEELQNGGHSISAHRATIEMDISWRRIDLDISLDELQIDVGEEAKELKRLFEKPPQQFKLFTVHSRFNVPKASLLLNAITSDVAIKTPVYFSIDMTCKEINEGCLALWFDEQPQKHNPQKLELVFGESEPATSRITLHTNNICCSKLMLALRHIWPDFKGYEVKQGNIHGEAVFILAPNALPYAEGKFIVDDLTFHYPAYELTCHCPELAIALAPQHIEKDSTALFQSIGHIDISKAASLEFYKSNSPYWTIDGIKGSLAFDADNISKLNIEAFCSHQAKRRPLSVEGQARLDDAGQRSMSLEFSLKGDTPEQEASVNFTARQLGEHWNVVEAQIKRVGKEEFDFVQNLCGRSYPLWQQVAVSHGLIDASLLFYLKGLNITEVKIDNITANQIDLKINPWDMTFIVDEAQGVCSLDFSVDDVLKTVHADLKVADGHLNLAGLDQAKWQFSNIHADLAIRKGVVQKTIVKAKVAGLDGEIEIDGNSPNEIAHCDFNGRIAEIAEALPLEIKEAIEKKFSDDEIRISAGITRGFNGVRTTGKLFLNDRNGHIDEFEFGFSLEKPTFALKDGWFKSAPLSLDKFISPFIFRQNQMSLSGTGEFQGVFDEKQITVNYDARDLILENSDFCINVKSISSLPSSSPPNLVGMHVFDLQSRRSIGHFPIFNGTYFEKNSGLLFTDVCGKVILEDDKAQLSQMETFCNGIFFAGEIFLDWSMPGEGVFEVDVRSHEMQGKVSQVQNLFSHFDQSLFFLKLPIEGNVEFRKKGGHLHFSIFPGDYTLQAEFQGAMSDGSLCCQVGDVAVQELGLNFQYDHQASQLEFTDIQGTLMVGSPGHVEEYAIAGEHIRFTDYVHNQADFDLYVGDKKRNLLRLVGNTHPLTIGEESNYIDFTLDRELSHFGNVHPTAFNLTLRDWSEVTLFKMDLDFHLKTLLQDLQRFSRTGFFFLSRSLLKELNDIQSAEGEFKVNLNYDGQQGVATYHVIGSDVSVGTYNTRQFLLNGKKKGSTWTIDQLQFDNISLAADILKESNIWNVNFLGARLGNSLLLGLEGQYNDDESLLDAKINLLEVDLAHLNEWSSLKSLVEEFQLDGNMRANGKVQLVFDKSLPQCMRVNAQLNCALRNGKWRGLLFQDFENAFINYSSEKGFGIKDVKTALKSAKDGSTQADLFLQSANSDFTHNELLFEGLAFRVPAKNLTWFAENLQQSFPDLISPSLVEMIQNCKSQGELKGQLKFEFSQPHCALRLILNDGVYHFMHRDHDLSHFVLEYDPFELKITSKYRFERHQFWLMARSPAPAINKGEIILSEHALEAYHDTTTFPITVNWELNPTHGLVVNKIEGSLCGVTCNLVRDLNHSIASDQFFLTGDVQVNLLKARALINPEIAAACAAWEIGQGYQLKGLWAIAKDDKPISESLTFQGEVLGRDFEIGGYQFYNLSGQVGYSGNALRATHVSVNDPSGSLHINDVMFSKKADGSWSVNAPSLSLADFRPSLLRTAGMPPPKVAKALIIRQFELRDFQGTLGDRKSYLGKGRLLFVNPPKKNLQHTIFALPAELMTRLGLDLAVLNPVRGMIYYDIKDSKMVFTRFKDVYSKGRLSKFYLSNSGFQSHMDFDGNLNLQIRMKQYNLFFKLAELFTVTVKGDLKKPTYSLQKQSRPDRLKLP